MVWHKRKRGKTFQKGSSGVINMSEVVEVKLTKNEAVLFQKFAELKGLSLEKAMKEAFFEKIDRHLKKHHPEQ